MANWYKGDDLIIDLDKIIAVANQSWGDDENEDEDNYQYEILFDGGGSLMVSKSVALRIIGFIHG